MCAGGVWGTWREMWREKGRQRNGDKKRDGSKMKAGEMKGKKGIKVREREHIKEPAWRRAQGARQEKREVNIFHPTSIITFHHPPLHRTPDSQNGWEKGGEMRRVNKEISMSASKNPFQPSTCQDHDAFWMGGKLWVCLHPERCSPGEWNQTLHHKMSEER